MSWRPKDWHKTNPYELDIDATKYNAFEEGANAMLEAIRQIILECDSPHEFLDRLTTVYQATPLPYKGEYS